MTRSNLAAMSAALVLSVSPGAVLAQGDAPAARNPAAQNDVCRELVSFLERRGDAKPVAPVTLDQARTYQRDNDVAACRDGVTRIQQASITLPATLLALVKVQGAGQRTAEGADIMVQPGTPTVTVQQPRPEITVRQPQPVVTVNIPRPEITIRMPQPDVNVAQAQPQVQVVQPARPQVQVQRNDQQPVVRYESAEPKILVNQAQGQPQVRVVPMTQEEANAQGQANTGSPQRQVRQVSASDLTNKNVMNARGQQVGDVERLVRGEDKRLYAVVGHGGTFGLGEKEIVLPLDRLTMHDGRLMVVGLTDDQIKAMPGYDAKAGTYTAVEASTLAPLTVAAVSPTRNVDAADATGTVGNAPTRSFTVSSLMNREIYNLRGQQLGDVERVLTGQGDKMYVVIGHGGFLGLGEKQVLLSVSDIMVRGDRLVIPGLTDDEIRALPEFDRNTRGYRDLDRNQQTQFSVYRG